MPLEKIGLVARQADQRDARVGYAVLTAAGQELLDHASATAHAVGRELLQDAPAEQLGALSAVLGRLAG